MKWLNSLRAGNSETSQDRSKPGAPLSIGQVGAGTTSSWDYGLNVVGESHYQGALQDFLRRHFAPGGIPERGEVECWVGLVPEPDNAYDKNAVAAHIENRKIGFVPRDFLSSDELQVVRTRSVRVAGFVGWARKPIYGVRVDLEEGDLFGRPRPTQDVRVPVTLRSSAGKVDGQHYTDFVELVKQLKRDRQHPQAVELLLRLVDATEREATAEETVVAPWYYEQLAIIYRKDGQHADELDVLRRFAEQRHGEGPSSAKLMQRLAALEKQPR